MSHDTHSAEAAYLTKANIVSPLSAAAATAAEVAGRADIAARLGVSSVTGGTVKRG
jgi:hypothetical protein